MDNSPAGLPELSAPWLLCRMGEHTCALPVEYVVEVMRLLPVKPLAGAPLVVRGVAIIRGDVVPVIDAGRFIGQDVTAAKYLITIRVDDRIVALAVDGIVGIHQLAGIVADLPPLLRDVADGAIASIQEMDSELLLRLRAAHVLPPAALRALQGIEGSA